LRFAVHGTGGSWIKYGLDSQEPAIEAGVLLDDDNFGVDLEPGFYTSAQAPERREAVRNERGDYRQFWHALMRAIRGDGPNPVPPAQALRVMELLEASMDSSAQGVTIRFP
jgi:predicted dehydrogenase